MIRTINFFEKSLAIVKGIKMAKEKLFLPGKFTFTLKGNPSKKMVLTFFAAIASLTFVRSQNVTVAGALVGNGTYPTLEAAFTAINGGAQTAANISINLVGNTTETVSAVLNNGAWSTLSITPSGAASRTVSGSIAGPLIDLNGAQNVIINGLNTGGNALTLSNNDIGASSSTIRFISGASNNGISNCTILGASTSNTLGNIFFSTGITGGNSNNTLISNTITAVNSTSFPTNLIYSSGTSGFENTANQINNNVMSDFFNPGLVSGGVVLAANNNAWIISGNRFFQSALRTYTTANTHNAVLINGGSNYTINNNIIGYSAANATGTLNMGGTIATRFTAISLNATAGGTVSTVQGNTVSAITLSTSSGAATAAGILCGISLTGGNAQVQSNVIGGTTGVNLLQGFPTTSQGALVGINAGTTGSLTITGNTIGGLSSSGITAALAGGIFGINVSSAAASLVITNNIIGNTTSNNMRAGTSGLTTGSSLCVGINFAAASSGTVITQSNTIQNFASYGTGTTGTMRGIFTTGTSGATTYSVVNNRIMNFTTDNGNTNLGNGQLGTLGIGITYGTSNAITSNTISNIVMIGTANTGVCMAGISTAVSSNPVISANVMFDFSNAATSTSTTAPAMVFGVYVRGASNNVTINNNMISFGTGQSANTSFIGVGVYSGGGAPTLTGIYYNTINIAGVVATGAQPSFGIYRGNFSTGAVTFPVDIRNNLITNTRSGGTGVHCAISNNYGATAASNIGWGVNASNNNVLNAANPANVGWWNTAQTFAGWQTTAASDAASYSGISVNYVNPASDLHLNMGLTPTLIESNGQTIASINTDIDNQVRPGPFGSVNGGAFLPDIGADEIDAVPLDINPPAISYTPLSFTCSTGNRTFTVNISDLSGIPTTGTLQPRVYFRKNVGPWFSSQGNLSSGTANNGVWSFTINAATMGGLAIGDLVSYYVIAQDVIPNIGSNPSTGLVASNVNSVTTAPTSPNSYPISGSLAGLYTVGSTGTYTSLTAAANAYNTSCLTGSVVFSLIDATYPSEIFPITFLSNTGASLTNSLLIKPAAGISPTITGSSTVAILVVSGGDFINIDGSNGNVINSICPQVKASKDLTIINTNVSTASGVVAFITTASGDGATNNSLMNSVVIGSGSQATGVGVNISGPSVGSGVGSVNNNNNKVVNNSIQSTQVAIFSAGQSIAIKNSNNEFDLNDINGTGTSSIGRIGILVLFEDAPKVRGNLVANITSTISTDAIAISMGSNALANSLTTGAEVTNAVVTGNNIANITQNNTYSAGGVIIAAAATGTNTIANNMINNVFANGTAGDFAVGIYYGGGAGVLNVFHNSVNITGTLTGASQPNIALAINGVTPTVNIRNNILICTGSNGFNGNTGIGLAYTSTIGNYANLTSSNNDIFVSGTSSSIGRVGSLNAGTQQITLANWQTETGKDLNSVNINPTFVAPNDLHLVANSNAGLENTGTPLSLVISDIDCQARNTTAPDMGADEVCTNPSTVAVAASNTLVCSGITTSLSVVSGTLNDAAAWTWYASSCGGSIVGTGANVSVTTGSTTNYFVNGSGGCVSSGSCTSISLSVTPSPTVAITGATAVCSGSSATITATGASSYNWSTGSTNTAISVNPSITAVYTATGTTNGCTGVANTTIIVNALPIVSAASSNTSFICVGSTATLTAAGANTYVWNTTATTAVIAVSPTTTTNYTVTGTNAAGCSANAVISQSVSTCTGLNSMNSNLTSDLNVYPNPSNGIFNVQLENAATIEVTDILGRVILADKVKAGNYQLNLGNNVNGVYFVKATVDGKTKTVKIVKE